MNTYDPQKIEGKWQARWGQDGLYKTPENVTKKEKMYILPQLPYPSGSGLHVGHAEVYTACDIYARYQRMLGKSVLQVIGWDSFGLPAENYAIKTNVHPRKSTEDAIDNFRSQIKSLGISVDWDREVGSHNPDYYKWTQWFFLLMYKRGLAYRKKQLVNWCDDCKTVLANEQVIEGKCERSETVVVQKEMEQWYLRITDYADRLIDGLDTIDWPEETKKRQRDWIGRSEGAQIDFKIVCDCCPHRPHGKGTIGCANDLEVTVFTTRPDTIFGATYMVLSPEHVFVKSFLDRVENRKDVEKYIKQASKRTELERQVDQDKTGVELKGITAINPVNGEEIPVWIGDYVLASYGTGAIMSVPAHDERDFAFATKYLLPIREVVAGGTAEGAFTNPGAAVNSDFLNRLPTEQAKEKIIQFIEEKGIGKRKVQYRLRDWSVSRQRFWGAPIPMIVNEERREKKRTFVLIHGFRGRGDSNYFPRLQQFLEAQGHTGIAPTLPDADQPNLDEQVEFLINNIKIDEDSVILGHSLGGPVIMKWLAKTKQKVAKVIFSDSFYEPVFNDHDRPLVEKSTDWKAVSPEAIKNLADEFVCVIDNQFPIIPQEHSEQFAKKLDARIVYAKSNGEHFDDAHQPVFEEEVPVSGLLPLHVEDLPVLLPDDVDFKPTGQSPLTYSEDFSKGVEEKYGKGWKREVDTLDTFMCSSWYYYRYLDPHNDKEFASPNMLKQWMPVDFYLGGAEHVNGHLLYSRFFTKVLHDAGYIDFDEPFLTHRHQGIILGEDNRKMSKRWGNVINPTDVVNEYGADTCRMYEMFMGPLEETKPWNTGGVKGIRRFLDKVWKLQDKTHNADTITQGADAEALLHKTIKKVTDDTATLQFNTAIAKMMELVNVWAKEDAISKDHFGVLVTMLAPYAPHMAEELWHGLGHTNSVTTQSWPSYDALLLVEERLTIAVQVNGKLRATIDVPADTTEDEIKQKALAEPNIEKWLEGKEPKKIIYVKGRLVSVVM